MRLLHVTDFHFRERWFHWLAAQAGRHDVCCLSGDLLDMFPGSRIGLRQQARWVRDWLKVFPGVIYTCTGNHDWWPSDDRVVDNDADGGWLRKAARPGVMVDGASEWRDGFRFVCLSVGTHACGRRHGTGGVVGSRAAAGDAGVVGPRP